MFYEYSCQNSAWINLKIADFPPVTHSPNPPFIKGRMKFFKMTVMGGIGNFSCKWVETGIGGVHNGEDEKFLKSVSMVSKRVLTPYFMKTPVYCQPFPLSPPTPTPTVLSVVLFLWLNGWSRHIWCAVLLNHIMDLWSMYGSNKSSLRTLATRRTLTCVLCNKV